MPKSEDILKFRAMWQLCSDQYDHGNAEESFLEQRSQRLKNLPFLQMSRAEYLLKQCRKSKAENLGIISPDQLEELEEQQYMTATEKIIHPKAKTALRSSDNRPC